MIIKNEDAANWKCPFARTFAEKVGAGCDGPQCILWRVVPMSATDPRFVKAVQAEMVRMADGTGSQPMTYHKKAASAVTDDPAAHGLPAAPEYGFCGAGGKP